MSLYETDLAVITARIEAATDAQIARAPVAPAVVVPNPVQLTNAHVNQIALAWINNWPSVNNSVAGNQESWRTKFTLPDGRRFEPDQIHAVIAIATKEAAYRAKPLEIRLTASAVGQNVSFGYERVGGNRPTVFAWNFGDGATSASETPQYIYAAIGTYLVTCDVTDPDGEHYHAELQVSIT